MTDQTLGACDGNWLPWDLMADHSPGTQVHESAKREAAAMCASCPLTRCGYRIGRAAA